MYGVPFVAAASARAWGRRAIEMRPDFQFRISVHRILSAYRNHVVPGIAVHVRKDQGHLEAVFVEIVNGQSFVGSIVILGEVGGVNPRPGPKAASGRFVLFSETYPI